MKKKMTKILLCPSRFTKSAVWLMRLVPIIHKAKPPAVTTHKILADTTEKYSNTHPIKAVSTPNKTVYPKNNPNADPWRLLRLHSR